MKNIIAKIMYYRQDIMIIVLVFLVFGMCFGHLFIKTPLEKVEGLPQLRDPTYSEVVWFLDKNKINEREYTDEYKCHQFSLDTIVAAEEYGLRCYLVVVVNVDRPTSHAIIAFNTTDRGIQCFEPQTDANVNPRELPNWA